MFKLQRFYIYRHPKNGHLRFGIKMLKILNFYKRNVLNEMLIIEIVKYEYEIPLFMYCLQSA